MENERKNKFEMGPIYTPLSSSKHHDSRGGFSDLKFWNKHSPLETKVQTPIQSQIEKVVTNGVGFGSSLSAFMDDLVKTSKQLQSYLGGLEQRGKKYDYSFSGHEMNHVKGDFGYTSEDKSLYRFNSQEYDFKIKIPLSIGVKYNFKGSKKSKE